jgi:hypothetical protein
MNIPANFTISELDSSFNWPKAHDATFRVNLAKECMFCGHRFTYPQQKLTCKLPL